jgi:AcrR family transcriptional regulator
MATKAEQSEATRSALIAAARKLFAERGFAETSTEAVVQAAGVTRGALYHHFKDKHALFRAVYENLEEHLMVYVASAVHNLHDPMALLRRGAEAFLDACLDPEVMRVVLVEGPSVLGWETWREIDQAYGLGLVTTALELAVRTGAIRKVPVQPLAHVLLGGLTEGALVMANADDPAAARRDVGKAITAIVDGLAAQAPPVRAPRAGRRP